MDEKQEIQDLLRGIKENQQKQLEGQQEALLMQREQFQMAKQQFDRAEKLQGRAEKLQDSGANAMRSIRRVLAVILPVIIGLLIYLAWLVFR